ncbi:hypothetical protein [cf. Phormidesmis sp. LEGE 11477]|uniref:hypothetical protein n=1 Tax=cf. Phormidesmis sp. LEGE 11477 TaxID=1828680 RepID=UPI00188195AC|nr:hypothetical protein [cf. Phormidesmis sp. LEGE 11477]MBE9062974.1 hypothetical protein [cf. Phormidesmis sp. LEGE 11477]
MRFRYSTTDSSQNEFDSLPRIPLILSHQNRSIEVVGLVDSGATVNVLPYEVGLNLGATWNDRQAIIQLAGNLSRQPAIPFFAVAEVEGCGSVQLAFAWARSENIPVILGQTNFFIEFDVCFYRSKLEFEINPKSE